VHFDVFAYFEFDRWDIEVGLSEKGVVVAYTAGIGEDMEGELVGEVDWAGEDGGEAGVRGEFGLVD